VFSIFIYFIYFVPTPIFIPIFSIFLTILSLNKGKFEAEFKLLTEKDALEQPAGEGRNEPDKLPEPRYY